MASNGGFRVDVRAATEAAAAAELRFNGTCLALVSADFAERFEDWTEPVQLRFVRNADGLVDIEVRTLNGF